jgi:hypothetical protein
MHHLCISVKSFLDNKKISRIVATGWIDWLVIFLVNTKLNFDGFLYFAHVHFGKKTRTVEKS